MIAAFPDPMAATLAALRSLAPPGVTLGTLRPEDYPEGDVPALPYAMVRVDGTYRRYPVATTATMRVAVWAETEHAAMATASGLEFAALSYEGGPDIRGFRSLTGPIPTGDPDDGRPMVYFTVSARLRPRLP